MATIAPPLRRSARCMSRVRTKAHLRGGAQRITATYRFVPRPIRDPSVSGLSSSAGHESAGLTVLVPESGRVRAYMIVGGQVRPAC
jgi:hypothetical protein